MDFRWNRIAVLNIFRLHNAIGRDRAGPTTALVLAAIAYAPIRLKGVDDSLGGTAAADFGTDVCRHRAQAKGEGQCCERCAERGDESSFLRSTENTLSGSGDCALDEPC